MPGFGFEGHLPNIHTFPFHLKVDEWSFPSIAFWESTWHLNCKIPLLADLNKLLYWQLAWIQGHLAEEVVEENKNILIVRFDSLGGIQIRNRITLAFIVQAHQFR